MGRRAIRPETIHRIKILLYEGYTVPEISRRTNVSLTKIRNLKEEDTAEFWQQHAEEWDAAVHIINGNRKKTICNPANRTKRRDC